MEEERLVPQLTMRDDTLLQNSPVIVTPLPFILNRFVSSQLLRELPVDVTTKPAPPQVLILKDIR